MGLEIEVETLEEMCDLMCGEPEKDEDEQEIDFEQALKRAEESKNYAIFDSLIKADNIINNRGYKNILCSISGGSDSDVMMDIIYKVDREKKVKYVWFNTGLEYKATREHLKYLESKYQVKILRERAIKPIPFTCKKLGQPFISKHVSQMMQNLQKYDFQYEDESYEVLSEKYPKCKGALKWWCNCKGKEGDEYNSPFNIKQNKYLKEFLIMNHPNFKISNKCCNYAKKDVSHYLEKKYNTDLTIIGVRKAEGGVRALAYKNCFSNNDEGVDQYRPVFFYKDSDKIEYERLFGIIHSACYTEYGMERTGCAGCPYNIKLSNEMSIIEKYEPLLYKAINNIFKDSYEFTRKYREFQAIMTEKDKQMDGQISLFDYEEE